MFEEWWCSYWNQKEYDIDDNCTTHQRAAWDSRQEEVNELALMGKILLMNYETSSNPRAKLIKKCHGILEKYQ